MYIGCHDQSSKEKEKMGEGVEKKKKGRRDTGVEVTVALVADRCRPDIDMKMGVG